MGYQVKSLSEIYAYGVIFFELKILEELLAREQDLKVHQQHRLSRWNCFHDPKYSSDHILL